jgi:C-terminal processing protease CtpA/Prc
VLLSNSSFSAAEEFAYDMKALGRGLIVGVQTPGAANHALPVPIAGGFMAFIPKARAENPVTHSNWEGIGVTPDVATDPPNVEAARDALISRLDKK